MSVRTALEPYATEPEKFVMRRPSKMSGNRVNPLYTVWETLLLHAKASDAKRELPAEVFERYFKFAFVRNPWDLMVSMYHFVLRETEAPKHGQFKALGSFEAFVEWAASAPEPFPKGVTRFQSEMIVEADGENCWWILSVRTKTSKRTSERSPGSPGSGLCCRILTGAFIGTIAAATTNGRGPSSPSSFSPISRDSVTRFDG